MNLTLEQAMAQATKGPLIVHANRIQDLNTAQPLASVPRWLNERNEWEWLRPDVEANSALLAHWYNVGPELVKALKAVMKFYPALWEGEQDVLGALHNSAQDAERNANAILARANTVTIPD